MVLKRSSTPHHSPIRTCAQKCLLRRDARAVEDNCRGELPTRYRTPYQRRTLCDRLACMYSAERTWVGAQFKDRTIYSSVHSARPSFLGPRRATTGHDGPRRATTGHDGPRRATTGHDGPDHSVYRSPSAPQPRSPRLRTVSASPRVRSELR